MLQSHASMKDSFKVQDGPMDFHVTEYKFINVVLGSTLQLIFKRLLFIKSGMVSKKSIKVYLPFPEPSLQGWLFSVCFSQNNIS